MTDAFTGHGVAVRRKEDPPIPGEPFISMAVARRIAAEMVAEALAVKEAASVDVVDLNALCAKTEADAVSGLRYIEQRYGRLDGVGWDRVFDAHDELFRLASLKESSL